MPPNATTPTPDNTPLPLPGDLATPETEYFLPASAPTSQTTNAGSVVDLGLVVGKLPANRYGLIPRTMIIKLGDETTTVVTGDGQLIIPIPRGLDGAQLIEAHATVSTVSSSGTPTVQIRNTTKAYDMLTTAITIDASEYTSYDAATQPVVDGSKNVVNKGDLIAIDVDVAGTGTLGLSVILEFQKY